MSTEFLLFSDVHIHPFLQYSITTESGDNSRLMDTGMSLQAVFGYATNHGIRTIICAGDVFHKKDIVHASSLAVFSEFLSICWAEGIEVLIIAGNHDAMSADHHCLLTPFHSNDVVITNHENSQFVTVGNCVIDLVSYQKVVEPSYFNRYTAETKGSSILIGHQGIDGAVNTGEYVLTGHSDNISMALLNANKYNACFFGHFHEPQKMGKNAYVVGSLLQHNWGDSGGLRGFRHVTVNDDGTVTNVFVENQLTPRFIKADKTTDMSTIRNHDIIKYFVKSKDLTTSMVDNVLGMFDSHDISSKFIDIVPILEEDSPVVIEEKALSVDASLEGWIKAKGEGNRKDKLLPIGTDILKEARNALG